MFFDSITYLKGGTQRQQLAYKVLQESGIMFKLGAFEPILVGTIPLDIDTQQSDLDLICYYTDKQYFVNTVCAFEGGEGFGIRESTARGIEAVVANFKLGDFKVEIFGQNVPTKQQLGYRHMLIEQQLLVKHGDGFRQQIKTLKQQGYKTEPAFAKLLGLLGDPYMDLLAFEYTGPFLGLRKARAEDLEEIRKLFYDTITSVNVVDYDERQIEVWASHAQNRERWTQSLATQHFYVVQFQSRIVGFGTLAKGGYIDFLFVHKDFQRQGIAKLLLKSIEHEARNQRETEVWSDVSLTAVPFFKSQGFVIDQVYAKMVADVIFQNTIMRKNLIDCQK